MEGGAIEGQGMTRLCFPGHHGEPIKALCMPLVASCSHCLPTGCTSKQSRLASVFGIWSSVGQGLPEPRCVGEPGCPLHFRAPHIAGQAHLMLGLQTVTAGPMCRLRSSAVIDSTPAVCSHRNSGLGRSPASALILKHLQPSQWPIAAYSLSQARSQRITIRGSQQASLPHQASMASPGYNTTTHTLRTAPKAQRDCCSARWQATLMCHFL